MKTITLDDATFYALKAAMNGGATPDAPIVPAPRPGPTAPAPQPSSAGATYPIARLTADDKKYLRIAMLDYRNALRTKPGSHQLLEDMLTDSRGQNITDHPPNDALQAQLNVLKNAISAGGALYDPAFDANAYRGPLVDVYHALVAKKLAGG